MDANRDHHRLNGAEAVADAIFFGLLSVAKAIESLGKNNKPKAHFDISFGLPTPKEREHSMVTKTITNEQQVSVQLAPVTDTGKPAKLDGAPVWSVISGDSTVVPAPDGLSATLISSDLPGDTTFLVDADADLGSGVEDLQETIVLSVTGANAKNFGISFGTPEAKPVTPPPAAKKFGK